MADMSPNGRNLQAIAESLEPMPGLLATLEAQVERLDGRVGKIAAAVVPGRHKDADMVEMPPEPCVVLSDGEVFVVVTDRTCEPVRQWSGQVGPIARGTMVARLRAVADYIEHERNLSG